jgi:hypothetical protein
MKSYLMTTGGLFTLLGAAHVARTILEWRRLGSDPGFVVQGPIIGLIALVLAVWAWRLFRRLPRA